MSAFHFVLISSNDGFKLDSVHLTTAILNDLGIILPKRTCKT